MTRTSAARADVHRRRGEEGTSSIELVLYMPLLFMAVLISVQLCMLYLGHQVADAAAREAARIGRITNSQSQAEQKGTDWVNQLGRGLLINPHVSFTDRGAHQVEVIVSGDAMQVVPGIPVPSVKETVVGPREEFIEDTP